MSTGPKDSGEFHPFLSLDDLPPAELGSFEGNESELCDEDGMALLADLGPEFGHPAATAELEPADWREEPWPDLFDEAPPETQSAAAESLEAPESVEASAPPAEAPEAQGSTFQKSPEKEKFDGVSSVIFAPETDFDLSALDEVIWDQASIRTDPDVFGESASGDGMELSDEAGEPEFTSKQESTVIDVNCPSCDKTLSLRNEHLGIAGECVWCETPIVAAASGLDGKIRVFRVSTPERAEPAAHNLKTDKPDSQSPETADVTEREPLDELVLNDPAAGSAPSAFESLPASPQDWPAPDTSRETVKDLERPADAELADETASALPANDAVSTSIWPEPPPIEGAKTETWPAPIPAEPEKVEPEIPAEAFLPPEPEIGAPASFHSAEAEPVSIPGNSPINPATEAAALLSSPELTAPFSSQKAESKPFNSEISFDLSGNFQDPDLQSQPENTDWSWPTADPDKKEAQPAMDAIAPPQSMFPDQADSKNFQPEANHESEPSALPVGTNEQATAKNVEEVPLPPANSAIGNWGESGSANADPFPSRQRESALPFPRRQLMASENPLQDTVAPALPGNFMNAPFQDNPEIQNPISVAMNAATHSSAQAMAAAPIPTASSAPGSRKTGGSSGKTVAILIVLVGLIFGGGAASFFLPNVVKNIDETLRQQVGPTASEVWPGDNNPLRNSPPPPANPTTDANSPPDSPPEDRRPPRPQSVPVTKN